MADGFELVAAICGIILLVVLIYIFAFFAFVKRMSLFTKNMPRGVSRISKKVLNIDIGDDEPAAAPPANDGAPAEPAPAVNAPQGTAVKACAHCGYVAKDEFGFCPRCGEDLK